MKKLSASQKISILITVAVVIVLACVFVALRITRKSTTSVVVPTQNTIQNTVPSQTQAPAQPAKKNYGQIVQDITAKQKNSTATVDDLINLGVAYYNLGKLDDAATAYLAAIAKDPNNAQAYSNLANVYRDKADFTKAEQNYKTSIQLDSKNYKTYVSLAFLYNNLMDNKQAAIDVLNQGLTAIPDSQEMKNLLGEYSK